MARKEQLTVTIDAELLNRLREIAKNRSQSLSSVIESTIKTSKLASETDDAGKILEILAELKSSIKKDA